MAQVAKSQILKIFFETALGKDFDGVIAFDEAHNMANATPQWGSRGTKDASARALAGLELQKRLPNARVVYVSATAATEVSNFAYASRLGLWGKGTAFSGQADFISSVASGGVAAMELVARDMKAMGLYLSRSLSYNDGTKEGTVVYDRLEHALTSAWSPQPHARPDEFDTGADSRETKVRAGQRESS